MYTSAEELDGADDDDDHQVAELVSECEGSILMSTGLLKCPRKIFTVSQIFIMNGKQDHKYNCS